MALLEENRAANYKRIRLARCERCGKFLGPYDAVCGNCGCANLHFIRERAAHFEVEDAGEHLPAAIPGGTCCLLCGQILDLHAEPAPTRRTTPRARICTRCGAPIERGGYCTCCGARIKRFSLGKGHPDPLLTRFGEHAAYLVRRDPNYEFRLYASRTARYGMFAAFTLAVLAVVVLSVTAIKYSMNVGPPFQVPEHVTVKEPTKLTMMKWFNMENGYNAYDKAYLLGLKQTSPEALADLDKGLVDYANEVLAKTATGDMNTSAYSQGLLRQLIADVTAEQNGTLEVGTGVQNLRYQSFADYQALVLHVASELEDKYRREMQQQEILLNTQALAAAQQTYNAAHAKLLGDSLLTSFYILVGPVILACIALVYTIRRLTASRPGPPGPEIRG